MSRLISSEKINELYTPDLLFEVSQKRSPILKEIDELFRLLKQSPKDRKIWRALEKKIQQFSKIKKIYFETDNGFDNVYVVPRYKDNLPGIFDEIEKRPSKENAEETSKYIAFAMILFGEKILERFTNRECTAILLHELGHIYQHTANLSMYIFRIGAGTSRVFTPGTTVAVGIASFFNVVFIPVLIGVFLFSRTLSYVEHARELDADEYAVKYGYGEEIANAFHKLHKEGKIQRDNLGWAGRVIIWITSFLFPSSHPDNRDRICNMLEKMKAKHKKMYPKLKKKMNIIYADLKC